MTDLEIVKLAANLGAGGVIAAIVFAYYRRDFLRERDERQRREDRVVKALQDQARAVERLVSAASALDALPGKMEHAIRNGMQATLLHCRANERAHE